MLHDRARIHVEGGAGGNGSVSLRREAHVPRGGPDGGDGGHGGNVVLVCDTSRRDLASLRFSPRQRAGRGGHGQGKQRHGARGEDAIVAVPPGTQVDGLGGERFDLTEPGQRAVVARGGAGGRGNKRFATSTRQTPRFAERGLEGESGWIELRLKLLADAGLVGLPNAGKSSLLGRLTRAAPKVADYPFTTLEPVLGTIDDGERQLVLADIPGLISGAAHGMGLGHEFLAHVERCRLLVHLIAVDPLDDRDPIERYGTVREELAAYGAGLDRLAEIIVVSKRDLLADDQIERIVAGFRDRLSTEVVAVSSATGEGLDELRRAIFAAVPAAKTRVGAGIVAGRGEPEFEAEHVVYRPAGEGGFDVEREDDAFRVLGRGVEMLVARHDLSNLEALAYLEQRLREIGVIAALERAGFSPGDEVRIGAEAFDLDPR
ncbi:MAG: GTP-binding protein Obg/CgtA [Solirubrobacterales bacterium]|jgi:GTP-binding protein|nr:GTP-binding protein Obg/CgtA [Solirubrobacterales bacterium]